MEAKRKLAAGQKMTATLVQHVLDLRRGSRSQRQVLAVRRRTCAVTVAAEAEAEARTYG